MKGKELKKGDMAIKEYERDSNISERKRLFYNDDRNELWAFIY